MKAEDWVNRLKRRLGCPPLKLNTPDETINELIAESLEQITPYLRDGETIEGEGPTIDLSKYEPLAIIKVYPTTGMLPATAFGHIDEFTLINYASFSGMRQNITQITTRNLYRSELEALIPEDYKLVGNTLYLSGYTGPVTIQAITKKSLELMPPLYQNWVFEYSLALLKTTEGEIRSKVKIEGAPVTLNGEDLKKEGEETRNNLLEKLGNEISAFIITR